MVELVHAGRTSTQPAAEFDCSAQSISNWVAQAAADSGKPARGKDALSSAEREELARVRRGNRQLKMERDILAKATAWFAGRGDKTPSGLRTREREPGHPPRARHVPRAAGLRQRVLRVVRSSPPAGGRSKARCCSSAHPQHPSRLGLDPRHAARVRAELVEQGLKISGKRVARLMRSSAIRGVSRRRGFVATTQRDQRQRPAPQVRHQPS